MSEPGAGGAACRRRPRCPASGGVTIVLPADAGSPARARQALRGVLAEADRLDCVDAAELACTELVTNAVLHAHTAIEVTVDVGDAVRVAVRDGSTTLPRRRHYDPQATTGRGLALVAAITDAYGITDAGPDGKTVWFTVGGGPSERSEEDLLRAWAAAEWDLTDLLDERDEPRASDGRVRLTALPVTLWLAAAEHHDALLRELTLYAARHPDHVLDLVAADRAHSTLAAAVAAGLPPTVRGTEPTTGAEPSADPGADPGAEPGAKPGTDPSGDPGVAARTSVPVDIALDLPVGMADGVQALQAALDTAEALARAGELLARPGLPEVVAVRDWACQQVVTQLAGAAPTGWPGLDVRGDWAEGQRPAPGPVRPEVDHIRTSPRCVAAADETNRLLAVSPPLAQLLGWTVDELVGRRVVALVPPRLREAHVAGFTRHQSTGQSRVLGVPLTVPVLRADGTEITCRMVLEDVGHGPGASLYVAWFDPDPAEAP